MNLSWSITHWEESQEPERESKGKQQQIKQRMRQREHSFSSRNNKQTTSSSLESNSEKESTEATTTDDTKIQSKSILLQFKEEEEEKEMTRHELTVGSFFLFTHFFSSYTFSFIPFLSLKSFFLVPKTSHSREQNNDYHRERKERLDSWLPQMIHFMLDSSHISWRKDPSITWITWIPSGFLISWRRGVNCASRVLSKFLLQNDDVGREKIHVFVVALRCSCWCSHWYLSASLEKG